MTRKRLRDRADLEARIHEIRTLLEQSDTATSAADFRNGLYSATAAITMMLQLVIDLVP